MALLKDDVAYFLALAGSGSLARAAEGLGLTQPALSKSVQRLERHVGTSLVTRTSKGSELTPAGCALAARMRLLDREADDALQEARDVGGGHAGQLRIGATPAASLFALDALLPVLLAERPAAGIGFVNAFSEVLLDSLVRKDIELMLGPLPDRPPDDVETEFLFDDPYCLIVNDRHPLARSDGVSLADMATCTWASSPRNEYARQQTEALFASHGLGRPRVVVEVNSLPALLVAIANTQLVSMINSRGVLPGHLPANVTMRPIVQTEIRCAVGMLWRRGFESSIAVRARQLLRAAAAEIGETAALAHAGRSR